LIDLGYTDEVVEKILKYEKDISIENLVDKITPL
jgi:uncharacterized protein YlzI (FlbEa/FlbD family)